MGGLAAVWRGGAYNGAWRGQWRNNVASLVSAWRTGISGKQAYVLAQSKRRGNRRLSVDGVSNGAHGGMWRHGVGEDQVASRVDHRGVWRRAVKRRRVDRRRLSRVAWHGK